MWHFCGFLKNHSHYSNLCHYSMTGFLWLWIEALQLMMSLITPGSNTNWVSKKHMKKQCYLMVCPLCTSPSWMEKIVQNQYWKYKAFVYLPPQCPWKNKFRVQIFLQIMSMQSFSCTLLDVYQAKNLMIALQKILKI